MARAPVTTRPVRLPWPSLLVLAGATFVLVTGEMLPTAVLPRMSADLGVTTARTGLLVSAWALTVVVASVPLVRLTGRWGRRDVVAGALVVFAASALLTAAGEDYAVVLAARLVGAAACGLLWSTVNAHTAQLVPGEGLGRAIAVVLGGATLGTVLGVPLASLAAGAGGWRGAFAGLAVLALAAAVLVRTVVLPGRPEVPATDGAGGRPSLTPVLAVAGLVGLVLVGHFAAYTFVTRLLAGPADVLPGGITTLLLVFGLASAVGLVVVGRLGDARTAVALPVTAAAIALVLATVPLAGTHPVVGVLLVLAWGLTFGALPPLTQTRIMRAAGEALRGAAGTVIPVVLNLGVAVGAAAGSAVVDRAGVAALPLPAAGVVALAAGGLALTAGGATARLVRRGRPRTEACTA
ncbi:MFS transporter [Georgenia faecalis]|uniref:MFS transporter n=1 Tax=Georgenia faecalis TaxID=2483799 RepID=UPI000FD78E66|nr:MFS transporter [Georgenia faecalis]